MNIFHPNRPGMTAFIFREKEFKKDHEVFNMPPCEWSFNKGATHTLFVGPRDFHGCGTRPAKLLKTVLYVMDDEDEDKWNRWDGKIIAEWPDCKPFAKLSDEQMKKWPAL